MIVVIHNQAVLLTEANDFQRFSLDVGGSGPADVDSALRTNNAGYLKDEHAFISADFIRQHAPDTGERESWLSRLQGMVDYASSKGWLSREGDIRAHINNFAAE
ncbi:hypothetical protein [Arthrobacter sulfonylureivorans]|uniref:Uncharacterized protein n=1 Tax=Arthrobacter sulfonylureivorans TaxID=2486855 RepID=A0ABY3WBZ0_9MICC|nr:hypothetical protein [Arthrobacter sulfonylureivorans]UNK47878.1 hypothetical protein MNQ99_18585 [Arthrobacter sulfonylureivorans]